MSNKAHRRPTQRLNDASLDDVRKWERLAQLQDIAEGHRTHVFVGVAKHEVTFDEVGPQMFAVICTCGFQAMAPFGETHAERIKEAHFFRYRLIPDPRGAKYRA